MVGVMRIKSWFKQYGLFVIAGLIGILLLFNIYAMYENHLVIKHNKTLQEEAFLIKVNSRDIIRNLNFADMALRSYVLVKKQRFLDSVENASQARRTIFKKLDTLLLHHHYPMQRFYEVRDSVNSFYETLKQMEVFILSNRQDEFLQLLRKDPGFKTWETCQAFCEHVNRFEKDIFNDARHQYERATIRSYGLQILLFFIAMPTLIYMAYYASRSFNISRQLVKAKEQNAKNLAEQNEQLEFLVKKRTDEVLRQNEELHDAQALIEEQNQTIQKNNDELKLEVERQTSDLKRTNHELAEQNTQLEQFAYIISHNLRAPLARLVGLSNLFERSDNREDEMKIIKMITSSTIDLDHVIQDLSNILRIHKSNTQILSKADLRILLNKITKILHHEIKETKAKIVVALQEQDIPNTLPQYIESILYNLISNAIKYRHPDRPPVITLQSFIKDRYINVEIADNGLGLDLDKYKQNLFSLYKRFHFHVEGKGLGLYLVKTQVAALDGKINVTSKLNEGTTFIISFKK